MANPIRANIIHCGADESANSHPPTATMINRNVPARTGPKILPAPSKVPTEPSTATPFAEFGFELVTRVVIPGTRRREGRS